MTATHTSRRFTTKRVAYRTELVTPTGSVIQLGKNRPDDLPGLREQFAFDGFEVRMIRITSTADDIHTETVEL